MLPGKGAQEQQAQELHLLKKVVYNRKMMLYNTQAGLRDQTADAEVSELADEQD